MQEIRFKTLNDKIDAEGRSPIYLFFNYSNYQFRYFTKEKVKAKDWDVTKMRFKRSFAGFQQANDYLDILEEKLRKAYREYMHQGIVPTPAILKSELLPSLPEEEIKSSSPNFLIDFLRK
jgi:integrase/recombinase XerD